MVYVVGSETNSEKEQEIEIKVGGGSENEQVSSEQRLEFVLKLAGIGSVDEISTVLEKAKDMGLTAEDLEFIEQRDVDSLLSECSSLQRRKFVQVCEYLKRGGTLTHGTTMTQVYKKNKSDNEEEAPLTSSQQVTTTPAAANAPTTSHPEAQPQNAAGGKKNYFGDASKAFYQIPQQIRKFERFKRTFRGVIRSLKGCLKF